MTACRAFGDAARDRGLHLGDGVFETVLVADGRACLLDRHLRRLATSCAALGIAPPLRLAACVEESLEPLWTEERRPRRAALRITVTRGPWTGLGAPAVDHGARDAGLYILVRALPDIGDAALDAVVVGAPRLDPADPLAGHKTLSRMAHVEARRRAVAGGADIALLRTIEGDVAEADAANLFVVVRGAVVTPPLDRGILPGITRARVLDALDEAGTPATERVVTDADLAAAEEAFVTSSLGGVVPLRSVGPRLLATSGLRTSAIARAVPAAG